MLASTNYHKPYHPPFTYWQAQPNEQAQRTARILLVEDDLIIRITMIALLQEHLGYPVEAVGSGKEAIAAFAKGVDLVLMDVGLPDIDGIETTKMIRRLYPESKTPIVAHTSHNDEKTKQQCFAAGMNDFLRKGDSLETFQRVIAGVM